MMGLHNRSLLFLGAAVLAACGQSHPYSPPRPPNLPSEAHYVGGVDGGDWLACEGVMGGELHCRIFDPRNGELRRESWFRYCPQAGGDAVGEPEMLDSELGLRLSDVQLRRDRPDAYHPPPNATAEAILHEQELIDKYYGLDGVRSDCSPVSQSPTE